jgi:hypothetical protein
MPNLGVLWGGIGHRAQSRHEQLQALNFEYERQREAKSALNYVKLARTCMNLYIDSSEFRFI